MAEKEHQVPAAAPIVKADEKIEAPSEAHFSLKEIKEELLDVNDEYIYERLNVLLKIKQELRLPIIIKLMNTS